MDYKNNGGRSCARPLSTFGLMLLPLLPAIAYAQSNSELNYPQADAYLGEVIQPDEIQAAQRLITTLEEKIKSTYGPGEARRDAHPKAHGCVAADFVVNDDIPAELAHGAFQPGASYRAKIRFSNGSPNAKGEDITGDTRGMAIKLYDVPGDKLFAPSGHADEQDFILISSPVFFINDANDYASFFERVDSGNALKMAKIPFLLGWQGSWNAYKMLSQTIANPLETRYWSVVPYQLGEGQARQAVKYSVRACSAGNSVIPDDPSSNYLRAAMVETLEAGTACMQFMIQPRTADMDVEDSISRWSEEDAPFQPVATVTIHQQNFDTPDQNSACENESYNPWQSLPAHKPLGTVSRIRRVVYEAIRDLRHEMNGVN